MSAKKRYLLIIFLILFCLSFYTIAYSAIASTARVSGNAYARAEADARITDFRLASTNNATSAYEEFGKEHIVTEVDLIDTTSSITYYVEITNYGSTDVGIYNISGLPSGVNYSISDYNLKDKICDENNVCNGFIKKTFKITLTTTGTYAGNIQLNFDIRPFLTISYVGFSNQYLNEFIAGDSVSIDLSNDNKELVYAFGQEDFDYTYYSKILRFSGVWCNVEVGALTSEDFSYTGDVQSYKVKADGVYKIELWGAQGGNDNGGMGGYVSGNVILRSNDMLFFYVGSQGAVSLSSVSTLIACPFNGGGPSSGQGNFPNRYFGTGGGATDVRLIDGTWNDFNSLKSRIMVAAGGGGGYFENTTLRDGGSAGGLTGYDGQYRPSSSVHYGGGGSGGTQITGGYNEIVHENDYAISEWGWTLGTYGFGSFGSGGRSDLASSFSGGGAGYYGGGGSTHVQGGGGGSSFISWHDGCDAITEGSTSSNIVHTGQSIHYSDYVFTNTVMIDGNGYKWTDKVGTSVVGMPTFDGNSTMTGNIGNGYAKITPIAVGNYNLMKFKYLNSDYSSFSYVKDNSDYSITFNQSYADVSIKYRDGRTFNNYSYDKVNKKLEIIGVDDDIEISVIRAFDYENYSYSEAQEHITLDFIFNNLSSEHYPITMNYYRKLSSNTSGDYELIYTGKVTEDDNGAIYYNDYDVDAYTSYDIKVEFIGNNGYKTTLYDTMGTECFIAGTKVLSENGYVNIEDLQVGDYVYALDLDTNERVLKKVIRKFEGQSDETFEITVNGEKIVATPKHKFYVVDKGWIRAAELEVGDILNSLNNGKLEITNIKHVKHDTPVNVYNLTVEDLHNYFVSSDQLLVHNTMSAL